MKIHRRVSALTLTLTLTLTLALAACAGALAGTLTATDAVRHVEGNAFAGSDGHLMYSESHWLYDDGSNPSRLVLYRCPDGKPFARKVMHDDGSTQAPDFVLRDARTGYQEGVRSAGGKRVVFVRNNKGAQERTATLNTSPTPIIDAGFDAYIRNHWDKLGKNASDKAALEHRPYQTDHLEHTIMGLLGIQSRYYVPSRDIMSSAFASEDFNGGLRRINGRPYLPRTTLFNPGAEEDRSSPR